MPSPKRLGDLLVEMKFIDEGQLRTALEEQRRSGRRLGKVLIDLGFITESRLVRALSRQLGIEICAPLSASIHDRVKQLVPADVALRFHVLPIAMSREGTSQNLFVATADPLDMAALETIRASVGSAIRVRWMLAGETEIELALARHYGADPPGLKKAPPQFPPRSRDADALVIQGAPVKTGVLLSVLEHGGDLELPPSPAPKGDTIVRTNGEKTPPPEEPIPLDEDALIPLSDDALEPIDAPMPDRTLPSPISLGKPPTLPPGMPIQGPAVPRSCGLQAATAPTAPNAIPPGPTVPNIAVPSKAPNPPPGAASWGDLIAGMTLDDLSGSSPFSVREARASNGAKETASAPTERPQPADAEYEAGFDLAIEEATILELEGEVSPVALEPLLDLLEADEVVEDPPAIEPLAAKGDPTTREAVEVPPRAASVDGPLSSADRAAPTIPIQRTETGHKDEAPWNSALAEAAQKALDVDLLPPIEGTVGSSEAAWLGAAAALAEAAAEDLPIVAPEDPHLPMEAPIEVEGRREVTGPGDAKRVRAAMLDFIRGRTLDPETQSFLMRAVAAILVSEGLLDDGRLERALEKMKKDDLA
jgi:hypothetical protein